MFGENVRNTCWRERYTRDDIKRKHQCFGENVRNTCWRKFLQEEVYSR